MSKIVVDSSFETLLSALFTELPLPNILNTKIIFTHILWTATFPGPPAHSGHKHDF